jgi:hypothetical protein
MISLVENDWMMSSDMMDNWGSVINGSSDVMNNWSSLYDLYVKISIRYDKIIPVGAKVLVVLEAKCNSKCVINKETYRDGDLGSWGSV